VALTPVELGREIVNRCRSMGFAAAGIARAEPSRWARELTDWLEAGRHGTMAYLERDLELRLNPARVLEGARSFIMVGDQYAERGDVPPATPGAPPSGRIARYAQGRNYHWVIKNRLHALSDALRIEHPGAEFRTFVDTVPVLERELALAAGLGWQAKSTMVIHPTLGSYLLLGGVATTLDLAQPDEQRIVADHCGTCTRCIDACPTGAITPYSVDATRCISYLTIERRDAVPDVFHAAVGEWLYGCDVCQDVCPHNSPRAPGVDVGRRHEAYEPRTPSLDLLGVLGWDDAGRREAFRSSPMKRASLAMMKRNALIVAGNALAAADDPALLARVLALASDESESPMVRTTAAQVLARLSAKESPSGRAGPPPGPAAATTSDAR